MKYYSTKDKACARAFSLREAVQAGLAPDGGLFVPERIPQADMAVAERLAGESYAALAGYLAELFFGDDIDPGLLRREMERIYDFPLPLRRVGSRYTLELFHGPTFAFKDYGAGFMGRMIGLMGGAGEKLVILTATSGDTGSAVAHGFYGVPGVEVVLLYPEGKISRLQECQMTTLGGNIHPLRVAGTFDDCQRLVKGLFADAKFRAGHRVSSANSINLLRWIPQAFYYFYGYCLWRQQTGGGRPVVVVPSGNYGNLSAGMLARRMGLPLGGFVAASNRNDVVPEFLRSGEYRPRPSVRTPANAMDVGAPSNFERMLWLCGGEPDALRDELEGFRCDDAMIRRTIDGLHRNYGYLSDPHSAIGYADFTSLRRIPPNSGRSSPPSRGLRFRCLRGWPGSPACPGFRSLWRPTWGHSSNSWPGYKPAAGPWRCCPGGVRLVACTEKGVATFAVATPFLRIGAPGAGRA